MSFLVSLGLLVSRPSLFALDNVVESVLPLDDLMTRWYMIKGVSSDLEWCGMMVRSMEVEMEVERGL